MHRPVRLFVLGACAIAAFALCPSRETQSAYAEDAKKDDPVSFKKDIQPLLVEKCGNCHSSTKPKKGIDYVTSYDTAMKTVKAGKADDSRLYKSVAGTGGKKMPPKKPLSEDEVAKIKSWIDAGAKNN
jgi:uncharacterized membrane protein